MVRIEATYTGGLHTVARHGPSEAELETDAPRDNEGRGEAFSPTDLVATALGTCVLTVMGIVARRHGWELEGARVVVEKTMVADPARRIGRLAVTCTLPPELPPDARPTLERAARGCPVQESLDPRVAVSLAFE